MSISTRRDTYIKKLNQKHGVNIVCIGEYIDYKTKTKHLCGQCQKEFMIAPGNALRLKVSSCKSCNPAYTGATKRTTEDYIKEIDRIHGGRIEVTGQYDGRRKRVEHTCRQCEHVWTPVAVDALKGSGCPKCARVYKNKFLTHYRPDKESTSCYIEALNLIHFGTILPVESIINRTTHLLHQCQKCMHTWSVRPTKLLEGKGCPACKQSKGEKYIGNLLKQSNIDFQAEHTYSDLKSVNNLRYDFYIPSCNLLIEYDGLHHFQPVSHFGGPEYFEETVLRDTIKNEYARDNNIPLLRIPYTESRESIRNVLFEKIKDLSGKDARYDTKLPTR